MWAFRTRLQKNECPARSKGKKQMILPTRKVVDSVVGRVPHPASEGGCGIHPTWV
jgi:hypothetical protein